MWYSLPLRAMAWLSGEANQSGWSQTGQSSARGHREKEPAWHRRMRAKRSQARHTARLTDHILALSDHHGSKPPGFVAAAIERAAAATRHPAQNSAEPFAQALPQAPALPRKEDLQEQFARLLAPSHTILQKLEAQVLAINQSLMALHALTNSLAQNSQRYPGPAQVLEPPGAVEEHSLAADSAPQEVMSSRTHRRHPFYL